MQGVRRGRYIEAVARGASLLSGASLSEPQLAEIYRALTEAYVALDANGRLLPLHADKSHFPPTIYLYGYTGVDPNLDGLPEKLLCSNFGDLTGQFFSPGTTTEWAACNARKSR